MKKVRDEIARLAKVGGKPRVIKRVLQHEFNVELTTKQISNAIARQRKSEEFEMFTILDLKRWIHANENIPDALDEPFVVCYFLDSDLFKEIPEFRFFVSTRRLLSIARNADVWQIVQAHLESISGMDHGYVRQESCVPSFWLGCVSGGSSDRCFIKHINL